MSQTTANLLVLGGKPHWITPREDSVMAKGKGVLKTFWLATNPARTISITSNESSGSDLVIRPGGVAAFVPEKSSAVKHERHIDWITELCQVCIKKIVAMRRKSITPRERSSIVYHLEPNKTSLDEVAEVINLPSFDAKAASKVKGHKSIELDMVVVSQIREYVSTIASMYKNNPFHNFEHASHVTMSVTKLMSRIVAPSHLEEKMHSEAIAETLHDHTYGITSDPLTQFACTFSALIHDIDHRGVPNSQLVKENSSMAKFYMGKSVAEQNSVDLAYDLLQSDSFKHFRATLLPDSNEEARFRQLVVNSVMATDIMDKSLGQARKNRWNMAFDATVEEDPEQSVNRKATIVIERKCKHWMDKDEI